MNGAAARSAAAVTAVSRSAARGLPASSFVAVVPNAVDPRAFDATAAGGKDFHVVCAARLTPEKGVDVLLRATALLRADVPDLRVLVLGGTQEGHESYGVELRELAAELGVDDTVRFAGFAEHPFEWLAGGRVYAQPSRREGFGLAAAEAMAAGRPVVAAAVGGLVDVLDDGRAGVLIPPDDPRALADAINTLIVEPEEARRQGQAGREWAMAHYTVDRMLDGVEAVYRRVLA